ncbi:DUF554 family protein [Escherichia coli]|nr:DUF554 family protein [Escherichia coli]
MLIGPYVNGAAVVIGGLPGSVVGSRIPDRVKTALPLTFGLCSIGLGINLVIKVKFMPAVVLAMVLGAVIGIFGAMHEGMTGDPSILYIKTVLDLFTAAIFATMLGFSVMTIGIPLIIVQVALVMPFSALWAKLFA